MEYHLVSAAIASCCGQSNPIKKARRRKKIKRCPKVYMTMDGSDQ